MVKRVGSLVCLFIFSLAVLPAAAQGWWIDVNFAGATSNEDEVASAFVGSIYGEIGGLAAAYNKQERGAEFDFGGGYMFTPVVGLGVSITGQAHQTTAGLAISVPSPYFFNDIGSATGVTEPLDRAEGGVHIQAMINATPNSDRLRLRVFGGPSFLRVEQDVVSDIRYTQTVSPFFRGNIVRVTGFDRQTVRGDGVGYHVGADVSYFFSRVFGVGGVFKYSKAKVEIDDPLSEESYGLTLGGPAFGGGVRFRF